MLLPGEVSGAVTPEKSAEAIVAGKMGRHHKGGDLSEPVKG